MSVLHLEVVPIVEHLCNKDFYTLYDFLLPVQRNKF